jgi:hypothetical protein
MCELIANINAKILLRAVPAPRDEILREVYPALTGDGFGKEILVRYPGRHKEGLIP